MQRLVLIMLIQIGIVALVPFQARADVCVAAEREMVYGAAALEDARDENGFLESAMQFLAATAKAPDCAQAHFNLGLVYEKAGKYQKAIEPLRTYLKLAPKAADAAQVRKKIYALEYRAQKMLKATQQAEKKKTNRWAHLSGKWCSTCSIPKHDYQVDVRRGKITIFQEVVSAFYPCRNLRNLVNGTIDDAGRIHGIITQHVFAKTPNCVNGDYPWGQWAKVMEYSINGHINTAKNLIILEYYEVYRAGDSHKAVMKIRKR